MCDITAASYRYGTVIEAKDAEDNRRELKVSEARRVGLAINERFKSYMTAAKACISDAATQHGEDIGFNDPEISYDKNIEKLSARFDPGLILDFPKLTITGDDKTIEVRSCVTVCIGPLKSKLWTRANTTEDWDVFSHSKLEGIHAFFDATCSAINTALLAEYQIDFSGVIQEAIELESYGNIHVFAADCAGENVSQNLEQLCDRIRDNYSNARTIENPELANAMRDVTDASLAVPGYSMTPSGFSLDDGADFYPFRGSNGAGSLFVKVTNDDEAFFSGIVNADKKMHPIDFVPPDSVSNGVGTTAEIAAFFGGAF
ncbi:MAG: hypothetical protein GY927_11275 [bacterium]|nr:hypothetical protein [bacterium]